MKRDPFHSSIVRSAGYDAETEILEIEFSHGSIHQCLKVEEECYRKFKDAKSAGKFYLEFIRGKYEFKRIDK